MTDLEINERLFDIVLPNIFPGQKHNYQQTGDSIAVWVTGDCQNTIEHFSPATSVDALRKWVLPELVRRKRWSAFIDAMNAAWTDAPDNIETVGTFTRFLLLCPPATLAAAALAVLEVDNA